MRTVYRAADPIEAEFLRGLLESRGIRATCSGTHLWSGRGELAMDAWPEVCVLDERDVPEARKLLTEHRWRDASDRPDWICACGESCPATFSECWNCGASAPSA